MAKKGVKNIQATKTVIDDIEFASKFEAERYAELKWLEIAGEIHNLQTHVKFLLENGDVKVRELRGSKIRSYTVDFLYAEQTDSPEAPYRLVAEDTKGITTPVASLRISIFKALYPHIDMRVIKQKKRRRRRKRV